MFIQSHTSYFCLGESRGINWIQRGGNGSCAWLHNRADKVPKCSVSRVFVPKNVPKLYVRNKVMLNFFIDIIASEDSLKVPLN